MMRSELTGSARLATSLPMQGTTQMEPRSGRRAVRAGMMLIVGAMACAGCISVNAPDKPIVIELNINIKQEVVYRLAGDAAQTIDKHSDIF